MAIPKVMGIETEYGISGPGTADFNPVLASSLLINSYAGSLRRIRWDYEQESPLRDARGFEPVQEREPNEEDLGLANVILPNGARYYVDHAHPEYSTPECAGARDLVIHDKAGERILERSLELAQEVLPPGERMAIYKNNTDGKGNSYGCHENYLVDRRTSFAGIVRDLMPFFVTRQVYTGAGKVSAESSQADAENVVFQLSQRADFFEAEIGLETTLKRPIINTRDEPHADPEKYRRLHVIVGDANMSEISTFLKLGTTALVLKMIEDEFLPDLSLDNPVAALHVISWDPTLKTTVPMADGRQVTAVELQWEYLDHAKKYAKEHDPTSANLDVLQAWEATLTALEEDPMNLARELDWVVKYRLLEAYRERDGLDWRDPKLALIDLQYHDVRRDRGLYYKLVAGGKVDRMVTDAEVELAVGQPPEDTRAYFRGNCIQKYPNSIMAASWDSVIFETGREALQRVPMREPLRGTREHVEHLLAQAEDAASLVEQLRS
ncbi:MAG TPA: depupylase/deamidase Dop [Actinomycetota bacterium]|nr:depupylase/deamidase Dop [Actinomycetota bacterium]